MKNIALSRKLRELRNRKGFSQEELAENSGLSLRTVQRIENSETEPLSDSIKKISSALDINQDELFDWTIKEDKRYLKMLNLSALTFLFFPLLGIIVPMIMWVSKKDKLKDINKIGKDLINFEITWSIILCFVPFLINLTILAIKGELSFRIIISSSLIFFAIMYILNFAFIIFNTVQIQNDNDIIYFPKIRFLGD